MGSLTPDGIRQVAESDLKQGKLPADTQQLPQPLREAYDSTYKSLKDKQGK